MPKLDLGKAADFSLITQGTLASAAALFGGRDPNEWDIVEASYNGVLIHVFESKSPYNAALPSVSDSGGRRIAELQYPYRDGQTTDDLGRKPNAFQFDFMIFGMRYMEGVRDILQEFNSPKPGILIHPVRGQFTVKLKDLQITHESQSRKCAHFSASFVEHNFTIGNPRELRDSSVKGALSAALGIFATIDKALAKIEAAQLLVRAIKNLLNSKLLAYKSSNAGTLVAMNATFNSKGGNADIPALLPTNSGGTRNKDGSLITSSFIVVRSPTDPVSSGGSSSSSSSASAASSRSPNDPFSSVPTDTLSQEVLVASAVSDLTKQVISRRDELVEILQTIYDNGGGLELYDTIIELRTTAVLLQEVLERGVASSNAKVIDFTVPRVMSLREVAFLNGLSPNRVQELDILNPFLLSTNYIESGVVVKVPVA